MLWKATSIPATMLKARAILTGSTNGALPPGHRIEMRLRGPPTNAVVMMIEFLISLVLSSIAHPFNTDADQAQRSRMLLNWQMALKVYPAILLRLVVDGLLGGLSLSSSPC